MSNLIKSLNTKTGLTYNGAITNTSSLNNSLDLFFLAGASRNMTNKDIISMFSKAFAEDKNIALKIMFWARDIRGGAGERRFFRIILKWLAENKNDIFQKILSYVKDYGRWDDLFFDEEILKYTIEYIKKVIKEEDNLGLLFKWLPREKSKNKKVAKMIRKELSLSLKEYRKLLSSKSNTIEQVISKNKWDKVDYKSVPSMAFNLYRNAFLRHDEKRFTDFIEDVKNGKEKINAGAIYPVNLYKNFENGGDRKSIDAQWDNLPNYLEGNSERIMPVCDISGSMYGEPMAVSVSLGVYISERIEGIFKDSFIVFDGNPRLETLKGSPTDRMEQLRGTSNDMSTNIQGVFDLLLGVAKRDGLKNEDLPSKLLIISDMEFNEADSDFWSNRPKTNFEVIKEKYKEAGYNMPGLIFWNVNGRLENIPAQKTDDNVALVSGYSPSILKSVLGGEDLTPMGVMLKTIEGYNFIDNIL